MEAPQDQGDPITIVNGETLYKSSYERMTERMVTMYEQQQGMPVEGEEVKEDIRKQLTQEQMQQYQQTFVSELMEESEIEILI